MNTIYYEFPYKKVLNYLSNNVSSEDLDTLYSQYGIEPDGEHSELEQLAEVITDADVKSLGYQEEEVVNSSIPQYDYPNTEKIVNFLSTTDPYVVEDLCNRFGTHDLEDVALAITDAELTNLGFNQDCDDDVEQNTEDCYCGFDDYDETLDYLEDVPVDVQYMVVDPQNGIFAAKDEQNFLRFRESLDPILIDDCAVCDEQIDNSVLFKVTPHHLEEVQEEVVINDTLNSEIFDENHVMLPEVKEQILGYVDGFVKKMADKDITIDYNDICLIGSNAGYLYTPESDIDIHLISMQQLSPETANLLFDEFDIYEAENPLFIGNNKVELGIEDGYDVVANSARRYSLVDDTWVDNSDENEQYTADDLDSVSGYEDIVTDYSNKIDDYVDNDAFTQASALKSELRQNRSTDLANLGALSMGNVVFKELRNAGAYEKLRKYLRDKELEVGLGNE